MTNYQQNYEKWLNSDTLNESEKATLRAIEQDEKAKKQWFSHGLSFGTAGLRGVMTTGLNAMNRHTVAHATQGLAALILQENRANDGVAIAYDSRNNSALFAQTAACVLAANGIRVYLFDNILVLDEITDFLDKKSCRAVMRLLEKELNTVESVFIVSHHAEELELPVDSHIHVLKNTEGISELLMS